MTTVRSLRDSGDIAQRTGSITVGTPGFSSRGRAPMPPAAIVPIHCDGWTHFTQSRDDLEQSFTAVASSCT
jgi:hypothetical protein